MMVVEYQLWNALGHMPHSTEGVVRHVRATDAIVFISHRWWDEQGPITGAGAAAGAERETKRGAGAESEAGAESRPENDFMYSIITRGLRALIRAHKLNPANVAVWCVPGERGHSTDLGTSFHSLPQVRHRVCRPERP